MDDEKLKFLESLVHYPEETSITEYKAAVRFDPKSDFGAKLVKHILGQANAGGGYIVIGCAEDAHGKLCHDPGLNQQVSKSYETTRLCQSVDSYLPGGQRMELQVHKVPHQEKVYPIISIQGFKGDPYFCGKDFIGKDGKPILKEGVVYIRDHAAKTVVVAGPEQWNKLLKVALEQRQTETLGQMRSLLEALGLNLPAGSAQTAVATNELEQWRAEEKRQMVQDARAHGITDVGFFEVIHFPVRLVKLWNQVELREAAAQSSCRNTGWPIGVVLSVPEHSPRPLRNGIRASIYDRVFHEGFDYWSLERHGAFYFLRVFEEDLRQKSTPKCLYFNTRIWRVAEAFLHCANLYRNLGVEPTTEISFEIGHYGLRGRLLAASDPARELDIPRLNDSTDQFVWRKQVRLGLIQSNLRTLVEEVLAEVFVLFDFWRPVDEVWDGVLQEFLSSRV